ncbi:hypothetical protein ACFJIS_23365 [Variovorax boronicumulans]|uniref:hypothetical protein n=1 Tax=Variovorax boronicumulans TaxID=436515 RepID=UPI0036F2EA25
MRKTTRGSRMGWLALVGAGAVLTACGGGNGGGGGWSFPVGGGTTNPPAAQSKTGTFLDAAVEGLDYVAGSAPKAATNAKGEFICKDGETVTFSAGALALGSAACGDAITPLTLAGGSDVKADAVVNRLLALQSFDEDRDPANGIRLTPALKAALTAGALDFNAAPDAFHTALNAVLAALPAPYNARMVDANRRMLAREHFEDTLASRLGAPVTEASTQTNQLGAIGIAVTRYQLQADARFHVPYEGDTRTSRPTFRRASCPPTARAWRSRAKPTTARSSSTPSPTVARTATDRPPPCPAAATVSPASARCSRRRRSHRASASCAWARPAPCSAPACRSSATPTPRSPACHRARAWARPAKPR